MSYHQPVASDLIVRMCNAITKIRETHMQIELLSLQQRRSLEHLESLIPRPVHPFDQNSNGGAK
jgi:hypothetical protein